ncbi:MAG: potassium transporter TrkG [Candidatus Tritonobacter lacicola]|nr:potassium transporter TrkG [Candidatus Tritonobacter lacicola]
MSPFDGICQAFTALSPGGFSPHDASIGYYRLAGYPNYVLIEYILIAGMILGGTNFLIHYRVIKGCVGSTAGGIKVLRIAIMAKLIRRETYRLRTPLRSISGFFAIRL